MTTTNERQKKIVEILTMLHNGGDFEEAKRIFDATFQDVDVAEITSAERELIASGLNPMEIQTLCNVHAAVFRGKIKPGETTPMAEVPGHPVQVMKLENTVVMSLLNDELLPTLKKFQQAAGPAPADSADAALLARLRRALADLTTIDKHYLRKENLIFPVMDRYGITAPPKVMWGVDDDIRGLIKTARVLVDAEQVPDRYAVEAAIEAAAKEVDEMVFKEEEIMLPMVLEVFTPADWGMIAKESDAIGYTLIPTPLPWQPTAAQLAEQPKPSKMAAELNAMAQELAEAQGLGSEQKRETPADAIAEIHQSAPMPNITIASPQPASATGLAASSGSDNGRIDIDGNHPARVLLPTGAMDLTQLTNVLRLLPLDLTFVDAQDTVRWFSDSGERVFPRTTAVLGRLVENCHPPRSVDKVKKILADFHSGAASHADFWLNLHGEKMVYIRYFAIRNPQGTYLGCLEVTQDITEIQQLTGEKRL